MAAVPTEQVTINLKSAGGNVIGARLVRYGDRFGKDYQYTHDSAVPVIEFRMGGSSPRCPFLGAFMPSLFQNISMEIRFSPDGSLKNALPLDETERLFRWLSQNDVIDGGDDLI
ncbi:MAG: hypothetical protein FJW96_13410 [Actinobacteria bacterium]|nr:hypothetical protein [Actinomycetota bacterium]